MSVYTFNNTRFTQLLAKVGTWLFGVIVDRFDELRVNTTRTTYIRSREAAGFKELKAAAQTLACPLCTLGSRVFETKHIDIKDGTSRQATGYTDVLRIDFSIDLRPSLAARPANKKTQVSSCRRQRIPSAKYWGRRERPRKKHTLGNTAINRANFITAA